MSLPDRAAAGAATAHGRADRRRTIFINYRREDSGGQARALLYALERSFPDQVFMDVKGLEPGVDYLVEIERMVGSCRAVLVLIGRSWLEVKSSAGRRRIDEPRDVVALEIAAALVRKDVLVIPVLVAGATLPAEEELPESVRDLVRRQCIHLTDQDWDHNVAHLVETLRRNLARPAATARRPLVYAGIAAIVLLAVAVALVLRRGPAPASPSKAEEARGGVASEAAAGRAAAVPVTSAAAPTPAPAVAYPTGTTPRPSVPLASAAPPGGGAGEAPGASPAAGEKAKPAREATRPGKVPTERKVAQKAPARPRPEPAPREKPESTAPRAVASKDAPPPAPSSDAAAQSARPSPAPTLREVFTSREVLAFQQFFGDPANRERGRSLVQPARWTVDPGGSVTFAPGQPIAGFFPMTLHGTRSGDRVTFQGVRTATSSAGLAYLRVSGQLATSSSPPVITVDLEFGRANGTDESSWEPTYRARARVRVSPE